MKRGGIGMPHKPKRGLSPDPFGMRSGTPNDLIDDSQLSGIDIPANISMFEMGTGASQHRISTA